MSLVVSDTSPLRALAHVDLVHLLGRLFDRVLIPPAVLSELAKVYPPEALPRVVPEWMEIRAPSNATLVQELQAVIDRGESEAIALALEVRADSLLIDEADGREQARRMGLRVAGVLRVLLTAKEAGMIAAVKPLVDRLRSELKFRVADQLYERVIKEAGE